MVKNGKYAEATISGLPDQIVRKVVFFNCLVQVVARWNVLLLTNMWLRIERRREGGLSFALFHVFFVTQLTFNVGSVDSLDRNLEHIQTELGIPAAKRLYIQYQDAFEWWAVQKFQMFSDTAGLLVE